MVDGFNFVVHLCTIFGAVRDPCVGALHQDVKNGSLKPQDIALACFTEKYANRALVRGCRPATLPQNTEMHQKCLAKIGLS